MRIMYMSRSYSGIKLRMGPLCWFFSPQRFDTVITEHLEEKNSSCTYSHIHPSVVLTVFQELFCDHVLPFMPLVYPLVSAASI